MSTPYFELLTKAITYAVFALHGLGESWFKLLISQQQVFTTSFGLTRGHSTIAEAIIANISTTLQDVFISTLGIGAMPTS